MAKRKQFIITVNNECVATKSAWNAAKREIERIMRDIAKEFKTSAYNQGMTGIEQDEYKNHIYGVYHWLCDDRMYSFTIKLVS